MGKGARVGLFRELDCSGMESLLQESQGLFAKRAVRASGRLAAPVDLRHRPVGLAGRLSAPESFLLRRHPSIHFWQLEEAGTGTREEGWQRPWQEGRPCQE